jgi:hypothetical protein
MYVETCFVNKDTALRIKPENNKIKEQKVKFMQKCSAPFFMPFSF